MDAGLERGDRTNVWLEGRVASPPKPDADIWLAAVVIVRLAVRRTADRHRMAEWEQDWALFGPKWSGHRT
ncbi:hypothetical protein [Streptomyces sp. NPDC020681]|uniref:hypothetical protein n=1 Tax=Streptomyces sp. NPDC020681 TaxID=3365083 RepID=UPI00378D30FF